MARGIIAPIFTDHTYIHENDILCVQSNGVDKKIRVSDLNIREICQGCGAPVRGLDICKYCGG